MDTDTEYLSPSFDPSSLTVPRLRSILVAHEISYPSSAKKAQLIELFNAHVAPLAPTIRSAQARTKRSSKGITDLSSGQDLESLSTDDLPTETPRRRGRKTLGADEVAAVATPATKRKKSQSRHSMPVQESEPLVPPSTTKRTRKTLATPSVKQEYPALEEEESPFSPDNLFQSGSSPVAEPRRRSTSKGKRASLDPDGKPRRRKSSSRKSLADGDGRVEKTTVEIPVARIKQEVEVDEDAGEEFTPEEQLELALDEASGSRRAVAKRPKRKPSSIASAAKPASFAMILALLGGFATVWRQEKLEVGYCGVGRPSTSLAGVEIPEWASALQPTCEPCPPHAYCYLNLQTTCESGFMLQHHPLSFGGLVPLPPTCEPDGEKARKVKAVADRAVEELRERNAKWECGELKNDEGKRLPSPEMPEEQLKAKVATKRRKGMTQEEFEDLWKDAIGEVMHREEVIVGEDGPPADASAASITDADADEQPESTPPRPRTLRSTSLARIPLSCAVRRSIRLALVRYLWQLISVSATALGALYTRWQITSRRAEAAHAKRLASAALDRLATQAARHTYSGNSLSAVAEPFVSVAQLRDDVLRAEFSAKKRQRLWSRVQKLVEDNSNVRSMVREGRSGDVGRVWEWIGSTEGLLEGVSTPSVLGSDRPRVSFGEDVTEEKTGSGEMEQVRHWDEGRPIY